MQVLSESPRNPHGQGFIVAINKKLAGKLNLPLARLTVISWSSRGWRSDSKIFLGYSNSSSRNRTPRCARLMSPGCILDPPPMMEALLAVWWGDLNGRSLMVLLIVLVLPRLCSFVTSTISVFDSGGNRFFRDFASIVFPDPGGPDSKMLCLPATAI